MATKWKNMIRYVVRALQVLGVALLLVGGISFGKVFVDLHYTNLKASDYLEIVRGTEFTESSAFTTCMLESVKLADELYTSELFQDLEGHVANAYEKAEIYVDEEYPLGIEEYAYTLRGKEKSYWGDFRLSFDYGEDEIAEMGYVKDRLLYEELDNIYDLPNLYLDYRVTKYASSDFRFSSTEHWEDNHKYLVIGCNDERVTVHNQTQIPCDRLVEELSKYNGYDLSPKLTPAKGRNLTIRIGEEHLLDGNAEWERLGGEIRGKFLLCLAGLLLFGIVSIFIKVKGIAPITKEDLKGNCQWFYEKILCEIGRFLIGEQYFAGGYQKEEKIRLGFFLGITVICFLGGCFFIYDEGMGIKHFSTWFDYENFIGITVVAVIFVINTLCYVCGNAKVWTRYKEMQEYVDKLASGEYTAKPIITKPTPFEKDFVSLSYIGAGLEENIENRVRAERTKIELVTNVSHDLKTPLTSIISYIDLLDRMEELPTEARDYVKILEKKAERLKGIVADVFELAKTTSGEISLEIQQLNVNKLLTQTLVSLEDRIEASGITIKTGFSAEDLYIEADGRRMYRVLQNLIDNALKYSLVGTRVYLSEEQVEDQMVITIKNTANYEMDFAEEDVTERFFRADKSRNTEGNGLGLSIAQGFTRACGGDFVVTIDGDQFKVQISFPLSEKVEDSNVEAI